MKSKYKSGRSVFALIVVCLVIFSFAADLFNIQVKNNEYYAAQNNGKVNMLLSLRRKEEKLLTETVTPCNQQARQLDNLNADFSPLKRTIREETR